MTYHFLVTLFIRVDISERKAVPIPPLWCHGAGVSATKADTRPDPHLVRITSLTGVNGVTPVYTCLGPRPIAPGGIRYAKIAALHY